MAWERVNPRTETEKYRRKDALPSGTLQCRYCGEAFPVVGSKLLDYGYRAPQAYCSKACADGSRVLPAPVFSCEQCGSERTRRRLSSRGFDYKQRFCCMVCANEAQRTGSIDKHGYRLITVGDKKQIPEHRHIMAQHLGRELLPHENVHHKSGIRDDNDLSNLELWSTSQPSGQRVEDKLGWCSRFLAEYGYTVLPPSK